MKSARRGFARLCASVVILLSLCSVGGAIAAHGATPNPANTATVTETDGVTTTNYPVQIARPFVKGEIPNFPTVFIDGQAVPTQADVKVRWPDGSVKHAVLSFLIPSFQANSTVTLTFGNQSSANNVPLTPAQMLDPSFDFDAQITVSNGGQQQTASARQMLQDRNFTYWTSGPIATTIILADHSANRAYDLGSDSYRPFRPIFHATFWPQIHKVKVRYIGEVANTEAYEDFTVDGLSLTAGNSSPQAVYSLPSAKLPFTMYASTRWTRTAWVGGAPSQMAMNPNLTYLESTGMVPSFDLSLRPSATALAQYGSEWTDPNAWNGTAPHSDVGDPGLWTNALDMSVGGGRYEIGLYPTWVVIWLYTGDINLQNEMFGQADLASSWPMHFREGNPAKFFDRAKTVPGIGKPISIRARPSLFTWPGYLMAGYATPDDQITPVGTYADGSSAPLAGGWLPDGAHQPDPYSIPYMVSGDYWYLEELQFWTSFDSLKYDPTATRGSDGSYGGIFDEVRGDAWVFRNRVRAAVLSPDGTPEQQLFTDLTHEAVAIWEGVHGVTGTPYENTDLWVWGRDVGRNWTYFQMNGAISPLHFWSIGCDQCVQDYEMDSSVVKSAYSTWTHNYLALAFKNAQEMGFETYPLLSWLSLFQLGQMNDPGYNPWLIGIYMTPSNKLPDGQWFQTWADVKAAFLPQYQTLTAWPDDATVTYTDHPYDLIARAALATMTDQPGGSQAWSNINQMIGPDLLSNLNDDPKWGIVPNQASLSQ